VKRWDMLAKQWAPEPRADTAEAAKWQLVRLAVGGQVARATNGTSRMSIYPAIPSRPMTFALKTLALKPRETRQ
jgi:hypothetical protein